MGGPGRDGSIRLPDGRVLEYWDGGRPDGRPVLFHPGTPVTRVLGRWGHAAAVDAGVRLVALSRPGYGGSTPVTESVSLAAVGRDTAALAADLGLGEFAVFGSSGGGPFAVATAIAAPSAVRALGVVGGIGPWRLLRAPEYGVEDRECLALLDAGDLAGAWECLRLDVARRRGRITPEEAVLRMFAGDGSALTRDAAYRDIWVENMRIVKAGFDGYIFDNVAWGGPWDVDPRDVSAPTLLLYGSVDEHCTADRDGRWYADRIAGSQLVAVPTDGHFDAVDAHWPEVLAGLLRIWRTRG